MLPASVGSRNISNLFSVANLPLVINSDKPNIHDHASVLSDFAKKREELEKNCRFNPFATCPSAVRNSFPVSENQ